MKFQRDWVTPLTIGAFGLLTVTGVLMFFHLDSGLNKVAHEWLSWVLVGGVALHAAVNWAGLKRHLGGWRGRAVLGVFGLLIAASFLPLGGADEPPFVAPMRALADAPISVLAQVARTTPQDMRQRLQRAGLAVSDDSDTVHRLVGEDKRRQMRVLSGVMVATPG